MSLASEKVLLLVTFTNLLLDEQVVKHNTFSQLAITWAFKENLRVRDAYTVFMNMFPVSCYPTKVDKKDFHHIQICLNLQFVQRIALELYV